VGELLLELLSEEIPAGYQRRAIDDLVRLVRDRLAAAEIPAAGIRGYVTPRRLAVIADGIPGNVPDRTEERRGPRVGAPQQALDGFVRAAGLGSLEQCEIRDTGRGEFYFAILHRPGRATAVVLPDLLRAAIAELPWPKSMRYPASTLRWVRPLTSVVCLFDGAPGNGTLPLDLGMIPVGNATRGHRFLAPGEIAVASAAGYLAGLEAAHVVLDQDRRRETIAAGLAAAAKEAGVLLVDDPLLLDEVTGLVEWPVVLAGRIDADFVRPLPLGLPPEVLATAMRRHQKYFSCRNPDGTPAPRFLFVANNETPDRGAAIVAGNERVLRARLADARFFWDQDRKTRLEDRVAALKDRVYHEKLGSMYDKAVRMERLAEYLADSVPGADKKRARRAALLAKADLSTGMVGEFPELQGVVGRYYALADGEDPRIADAIADHYKPLGPNDTCPTAPDSIVVALADKIDTLAALFAVGERPTGSGDPFALRRAAQGVIRIVLETKLRLSLMAALGSAAEVLRLLLEQLQIVSLELLSFIADRLKVHLRSANVRHDLIAAAFEQVGVMGLARAGKYEDDLIRLLSKVDALQNFLGTDDGSSLLTAYRRAANIVAIEERRDNRTFGQAFDEDQLQEQEERALAQALATVGEAARGLVDQGRFEEAMSTLATLRRPVDAFFDNVTVNADDSVLRVNRLRLLSRIRNVMDRVADFSRIEG
jgi:glycyl-tRNA synthetase beta chain